MHQFLNGARIKRSVRNVQTFLGFQRNKTFLKNYLLFYSLLKRNGSLICVRHHVTLACKGGGGRRRYRLEQLLSFFHAESTSCLICISCQYTTVHIYIYIYIYSLCICCIYTGMHGHYKLINSVHCACVLTSLYYFAFS